MHMIVEVRGFNNCHHRLTNIGIRSWPVAVAFP